MVLETCRWRVMPLGFRLSLKLIYKLSFSFQCVFNLKQWKNNIPRLSWLPFLLFFIYAALPSTSYILVGVLISVWTRLFGNPHVRCGHLDRKPRATTMTENPNTNVASSSHLVICNPMVSHVLKVRINRYSPSFSWTLEIGFKRPGPPIHKYIGNIFWRFSTIWKNSQTNHRT